MFILLCCVFPGLHAGEFEVSVNTGIAAGDFKNCLSVGVSPAFRLGKRMVLETGFFLYPHAVGKLSTDDSWYVEPGDQQVIRHAQTGTSALGADLFLHLEFPIKAGRRLLPYLSAGVGYLMVRHNSDVIESGNVPYLPRRTHSVELFHSLNLGFGGGIKVALTDKIGTRLDCRAFVRAAGQKNEKTEDVNGIFRVTGGFYYKF